MCATATPLQTFVSPASSPVGVPASDGAQQASKEDTEYILMLSAQAEDMRQRWVVPEPRVPRVRVREGRWGRGTMKTQCAKCALDRLGCALRREQALRIKLQQERDALAAVEREMPF